MRVRYRISLGNLSVRTGPVSDFRVEIDRGLSQWTIEWGIGLYVPVLLMYPITSDQTFDLSTRAKCWKDKKEIAVNMGWMAAITRCRRDFYRDNWRAGSLRLFNLPAIDTWIVFLARQVDQ